MHFCMFVLGKILEIASLNPFKLSVQAMRISSNPL